MPDFGPDAFNQAAFDANMASWTELIDKQKEVVAFQAGGALYSAIAFAGFQKSVSDYTSLLDQFGTIVIDSYSDLQAKAYASQYATDWTGWLFDFVGNLYSNTMFGGHS